MFNVFGSLLYGAPWRDYTIVKSANYDAITDLLIRYSSQDGANKLLSIGNVQAKGETYAGRSILTYATSLISNEVRDILSSNKAINVDTSGTSGHKVSEVFVTFVRIYDHCKSLCPNFDTIFWKNCHSMLEHKMANEWKGKEPSVDNIEKMIKAIADNHSIEGISGVTTFTLSEYHCELTDGQYHLSFADPDNPGSKISISIDGTVDILGHVSA